MNEPKHNLIVHVSEVEVSESTGMGRVEFHWQKAFERKGYQFTHIGPAQLGPIKHLSEFPAKAYAYFKTLNVTPLAIIAHEPSASVFVNQNCPVFLESHGIERRRWRMQLEGTIPGSAKPSLKSRLTFP